MVVESALSRHCALWPVVRFVTLSDASRHDRVGLRSLWRPPLSLPRAHTFGAITSSCLFADAVCFDHSSPVLIRSQSLVLSTAGGSSRPWLIGESWQRLGWRLRPLAATGRSQRFSPDLRSFLAHQNRRVSRSSAGAAVAGDAAVRFAACWFTDKAAMGATL